MSRKLRGVLEERLAIGALDYEVPKSTEHWRYMLGGMTAFLIVVIIVTGLYMAQFYNPTPQGAHDSVLYIISRAPLPERSFLPVRGSLMEEPCRLNRR